MFTLQTFKRLLLVAQIWLAAPILYLCILSVSAILTAKKRRAATTSVSSALVSPQFHFALLIPAHNEEVMLGNLLENLFALDYPKELYSVYVIADNCTDRTAELARTTGWVQVYERFDESKRGKGYALNWCLQKLEDNQLVYDAYVILDADSVVERTFLQAMARELAQGAQAMQACNIVLNVDDSPSTALRWMALALINHVRPLGRNGLGASSTFTGNGMCLSRTLLRRYPWQAFGFAEDYQYYLTLVQHGERVCYVPEAVVRSYMPPTFAQMRTQDIRWEISEFDQAKWQIALRLLRGFLQCGDFVRLEAIAELGTPPLSFLTVCCLLILIPSLFVQSALELLCSFILTGGLLFHIGTAFYLLRPPRAVYTALVYAPRFMIWKLWVYFVLRRSKKYTREWIPTKRTLPVK